MDRRILPNWTAFDAQRAVRARRTTSRRLIYEAHRSGVPLSEVTTSFQRELTAWHEAGHALVAVLSGLRIRSATIVPHHDLSGSVTLKDNRIDLSRTRSGRRSLCQFSQAGLIAQSMRAGVLNIDGTHGDFEKVLALGALHPKDPWLGFGSLYSTETLLRKHRTALDMIARALLQRGTLGGASVRRIVTSGAATE